MGEVKQKAKTSVDRHAARKLSKRDYEFIASAERAFKKVAKQVRAEAKFHGLKPLVWND